MRKEYIPLLARYVVRVVSPSRTRILQAAKLRNQNPTDAALLLRRVHEALVVGVVIKCQIIGPFVSIIGMLLQHVFANKANHVECAA